MQGKFIFHKGNCIVLHYTPYNLLGVRKSNSAGKFQNQSIHVGMKETRKWIYKFAAC